MTQRNKGGREALHSKSTGFSAQQARRLNPNPIPHSETKLSDFFFVWSAYSCFPLLVAADSDMGAGGTFVVGLAFCIFGTFWAGFFADPDSKLRTYFWVAGFYALISAVIAIVLPVKLLFLVALVCAPYSILRISEDG